MSCDQFSAGWRASVVGAADEAKTAAMTDHARFCPGCGKRWRELEELRTTLQIVLDPQLLPTTLRESISRQVKLTEWPVAATVIPNQVVVTSYTIGVLAATRPWVMFVSTVGFLAAVLMIAGGTFVALINMPWGSPSVVITSVIVGLFGIVCLVGVFQGFRYAMRIAKLEAKRTTEALERALDGQRIIWKFAGVATLFAVVICLAAFFLAVVGAALIGWRF